MNSVVKTAEKQTSANKVAMMKALWSGKSVQRLRFGAMGAFLGLAMGLPTTALGWNYSNVPLFWTSGIKPNVVMMIDNSGSMQAITTNEAFQRASSGLDPMPTQNWYWCNGAFDSTSNKCGSKNGTAINKFAVRDWSPPTTSESANLSSVSRNWYTSYVASSNCTGSNNGFFKNASGNAAGTGYAASGICLSNHGLPVGARVDLVSAATSGSISTSTFYVAEPSVNGFKFANAAGALVTPTVTIGTNSSWTFRGYRTASNLSAYITGSSSSTTMVALCNVTKAPSARDFYAGRSGNKAWLNSNSIATATNIPTRDTVGVLVSNTSSSDAGTRDACVRWKMTNTGRYANNAIPGGQDYYDDPVPASATDIGTLYYTPGDASGDYYGRFLLNTLKPATGNASINFDNNAVYPDTDNTARNWDATFDLTVSAGGGSVNNKFFVIPHVTRIEAAREVGQRVVLDFFDKMNIGLFTLNVNNASLTSRNVFSVPDGSNPAGAKQSLISTTEGMLPADLPASALDGFIGDLIPGSSTPLYGTQKDINSYYRDATGSPIKYRCQKNYAIVMTDGEASDTSVGSLDAETQQGYDRDAKTSGNDLDGIDYGDSSNNPNTTVQWQHQNVVPYTVGFGLENNLLKRAPLVNRVNVAKSGITGNTITLEDHGLSTGDYVEIVDANGIANLTNGRFYYAVRVDGSHFKLAGASSAGDTSGSTTNNKIKAFQCAAGGATSGAAGPCLPITGGGSGDIVISTGPGKAFFAFTPEQLSMSMGAVFNSINNLTSSASAVSTNTKQFGGAGTPLVYQARFNTEDWSGEVAAYEIKIDANGKATVDTSDTATPAWTTKQTLDTAAERTSNIYTWNRTTKAAVPLAWTNLDAGQQTALGGAGPGGNIINWLKGNTVAGLRAHSTKGLMGDVLNSDPVFLSYINSGYKLLPASNMGSCSIAGDYSSASGAGCTGAEIYQAYVDAKKSRPPMIFVGANDGMLHAFDANNGAETLAFLPAAVYRDWDDLNNDGIDNDGATSFENKLANLTTLSYDHRYFVDGSLTAGDAFIGSTWNTYLVGALGRGGRSVFAIDVTDTSYTAGDIKWEFTHQNMGYTYGKPIVARLADNKWYAIVPNGLDSNQDKASVFVINLANPLDYHELTTTVGSPAVPNGMMVTQVRVNSTRTVTDIYAGDMRGNLWKFDVYNEGTGNVQWPSGSLLFTAGDGTTGTPQSITGGIRVGKHPGGYGSLIYFGTGKYFETQDNVYSTSTSVPKIDSFYAVLDNGSSTGLDRSDLHVQSFSMSGTDKRISTQIPVPYTGAGSKKGWYIDLLEGATKNGERVVSTPVLYGGRVIFVSIIPLSGGTCGGEGKSWLNELDALDGSMLQEKVLDTNGDGKIDAGDVKVSSMQIEGLASDPSIITGQDRDYKVIGSTSTGKSVQVVSETQPPADGALAGGKGRMSWKQLQ